MKAQSSVVTLKWLDAYLTMILKDYKLLVTQSVKFDIKTVSIIKKYI